MKEINIFLTESYPVFLDMETVSGFPILAERWFLLNVILAIH